MNAMDGHVLKDEEEGNDLRGDSEQANTTQAGAGAGTATGKVSIYRLNEFDWWMARSLQEAVTDAAKELGIPEEEVLDELHPPYKVLEVMMWAMKIEVAGEILSFRAAMDRYLDEGHVVPTRFATT